MNDALSLSGVSKTYGSGETAVEVLRAVDLSIAKGEDVSLAAP